MQSNAPTVEAYLASLPDDRREAIEAVRKVIRKNLDKKYQEGMQYGMIGYFIPHSVYPNGYHCDPKQPLPFAGLASQKNYMSLYIMSNYGDEEEWFKKEWAKTGKKLDMGKCCVRFKKLEDVALEVVGAAIKGMPAAKYIEYYETMIKSNAARKQAAKEQKKPIKKKAKVVSAGKAKG